MAKRRVVLGRRDTLTPLGRREVAGRSHAQGLEDGSVEIAVDRGPGEPLDDLRQHDGTQVRVDERITRLPYQRRGVHQRERLLPVRRLTKQRTPRRQPGRMRQQVADRDALLPRTLELREIPLHRCVEHQPIRIHEEHRCRGEADHLGQRREVEHRCRVDRARIVGAVASHGGQQRDPAAAPDGHSGAGESAAVHLGAQVRHDRVEANRVEPHIRRRGLPPLRAGNRSVGCRGGAGAGGEGQRREDRTPRHCRAAEGMSRGVVAGSTRPWPMG